MDEKETAIQQKSKVKPAKFMGQRQMIVENNDKKGRQNQFIPKNLLNQVSDSHIRTILVSDFMH